MYVLVWCDVGHDVEDLQVLSYSEDEDLLNHVKILIEKVNVLKGRRMRAEYLSYLSKDVGFDIPSGGFVDILKVEEQKEIGTENQWLFYGNVSAGVLSEEVLKDAENSEYIEQALQRKLKKSFIDQVQWKLHYDLGYPAARVAGVKERISGMFESNQADIDKSAAEIVEYFERFKK